MAWMEVSARFIGGYLDRPAVALNVSNIRHQRLGTECGAYSIYYILSRISGTGYKEFRKDEIPDSKMLKLRSLLLIDQNLVAKKEIYRKLGRI